MKYKVNKHVLLASGITFSLMIVSLLITLILELIASGHYGKIDFINAGERWSSNGEPYATVALYTTENGGISEDMVGAYINSIDKKLLDNSITKPERGSSYAFSYSTDTMIAVNGPRANQTAETTLCGGSFFTFHPLEFVYGSGFLNDASIPNAVVLDENLAWRLFGATNVIGMEVEIAGSTFTVCGITKPERTTDAYEYTYGTTPRMYISYSAYSYIFGSDNNITTFEITLPNPVKSFAYNIVKECVNVNEDTSSLVEVSARYDIMTRYGKIKDLRYSWANGSTIKYPYWEREAKMADYECAKLMIGQVTFVSISAVLLVLSIILLVLSGFSPVQIAKNKFTEISDKREKERMKKSRSKGSRNGTSE